MTGAPTRQATTRGLVVQSYRVAGVPPVLPRCMRSVRQWAASRSIEYEFLDDRLFDFVPSWLRERCQGSSLLPLTDLARLLVLKERLAHGYDPVVWIDADVLIFDPDSFAPHLADPYAFCKEVWIARPPGGATQIVHGVNNAVTVMRTNNPVLDFYIHACQAVIAGCPSGPIPHNILGTRLLSNLSSVAPLACLTQVALLSPPVIDEVVRGRETLPRLHMEHYGNAVAAANLCVSLRGLPVYGTVIGDAEFEAFADALESSRGEILNRHLRCRV